MENTLAKRKRTKRQTWNLQDIVQKTKDRVNRTQLKTCGVLRKGQQFLLHMWHVSCYSIQL